MGKIYSSPSSPWVKTGIFFTYSTYLIWAILFVLIPIFFLLYYSLAPNSQSQISGASQFPTLFHYKSIFSPLYLSVLWRSLEYGIITSALTLLLAYPCAFILIQIPLRYQFICVFLLVMPIWLNALLRTYVWMAILSENGFINYFLDLWGFPKWRILYTPYAVYLVLVYNFFPYMLLPIYTALSKISSSLIYAAYDLGANFWYTFKHIWFPLSYQSIIVGMTMVFVPSVTYFAITDLIGGKKIILIGNLIDTQFLTANNWGLTSSLSIFLILFVLISILFFEKKTLRPFFHKMKKILISSKKSTHSATHLDFHEKK